MTHWQPNRRHFMQAAGATIAGSAIATGATRADESDPGVRRLSVDPLTGGARAVVVRDNRCIYCGQESGANVEQTFRNFYESGGLLGEFVQLHVVAKTNAIAQEARKQIEAIIPVDERPAITYVVGALADPEHVVAFDGCRLFHLASSTPHLDSNARLYISGQAEKGESVIEATRRTMESLETTLKQYGLKLEYYPLQIKAFLTPISEQVAVTKEILSFFDRDWSPNLVFVEWKSSLPIEIELVAKVLHQGTLLDFTSPVQFATPYWLKSSPVFSRVSLTNSRTTIYVGGLYGEAGTNGEAQVRSIFGQLKDILRETGSDLRHLAKATYYVSDEDASKQLNLLRPEFYDPARPPAASKAFVAGVGFPGRSITLDMIAVPKDG